ncbi:unnamed protein product [Nesidiocoris tenuis]|uniref:Uncharacterized protein n=1 Tax=Nesidiocoris tenuis TaxID=355587 RepID=A0A6H5HMF6_9HEMI|nr:unnamed protein product [Nesidiocoris tenuis]
MNRKFRGKNPKVFTYAVFFRKLSMNSFDFYSPEIQSMPSYQIVNTKSANISGVLEKMFFKTSMETRNSGEKERFEKYSRLAISELHFARLQTANQTSTRRRHWLAPPPPETTEDFHVDDVIFGNTRIPRTTPASLSVGGSWNYEQANLTLPSARSPAARSTAKSAGGKESSAVRTVSTRTADCAIGEMRERGNRCHPAAEGVIPLRRGTRGAEDDLAVRPWGAGRAPSGDR